MTNDPFDRYGTDVLSGFSRRPPARRLRDVTAEFDLVVEHVGTDFCGSVVRVEAGLVELEDRNSRRRSFPLGSGFLLEGEPVRLVPPAPARRVETRTASGSVRAAERRARVARDSRIFVEGRHDAELVEKIWGDDLREEGVVIELLDGVDNLEGVLAEFRPDAGRRAGVLVDHLVPGSKESRVASAVQSGPYGGHVLVLGHPYVDVWQAVRPAALGIRAWPGIPRAVEWKSGICQAFGWPHDSPADIARAWRTILAKVGTYADLEPALLGRMEELIDFVTAAD